MKIYMKSRMREYCTYGSVKGTEASLSLRKKGRWSRDVPTRLKMISEKKLYKILLILIVLFSISSILGIILETIIFEGKLNTIDFSFVYLILAWIELIWLNKLRCNSWIKWLIIFFHIFASIILFVFINEFLSMLILLLLSGLDKLLYLLFIFQSTIAIISYIYEIKNDDKNFNHYRNAVIIVNAIICLADTIIILTNDISVIELSIPIIQVISLSVFAIVISIGIIAYDKYQKCSR